MCVSFDQRVSLIISQGRLDYSPAPHLCQIRAPRVISSAYRERAILEAAMGNVEIHPLTADRWADFERLFGPRGAYAGCWCMWPRLRSRDFAKRKGPENKEAMKEVVESEEPPGLLAYVDGEPVGWVALDRRERLAHFEYSRKLKPLDRPEGLWSILCFVTAKRHRRQGLMTRLLDAALEYARERGARAAAAYPSHPPGAPRS